MYNFKRRQATLAKFGAVTRNPVLFATQIAELKQGQNLEKHVKWVMHFHATFRILSSILQGCLGSLFGKFGSRDGAMTIISWPELDLVCRRLLKVGGPVDPRL